MEYVHQMLVKERNLIQENITEYGRRITILCAKRDAAAKDLIAVKAVIVKIQAIED